MYTFVHFSLQSVKFVLKIYLRNCIEIWIKLHSLQGNFVLKWVRFVYSFWSIIFLGGLDNLKFKIEIRISNRSFYFGSDITQPVQFCNINNKKALTQKHEERNQSPEVSFIFLFLKISCLFWLSNLIYHNWRKSCLLMSL